MAVARIRTRAPQPAAGVGVRLPHDSGLFFKLVRIVNVMSRPFVETLSRQHRISLNEWRVMVVIASHPGCAAHQVARATGLDKMSVSRAIAALDRHRRLARRPDPHDARRTLLSLNAAGARLFRTIGVAGKARESTLLAGLDGSAQARLAQLLDRMIAAIEAPETTA